MNHLKWMGHSSTIMDIQRALRNDNETCEVTLVAKDGINVRAHLFVLSTCSDLMRNLLVDVPTGHEATIVLPDIRGSLLESMLSFIYMGETSLPSSCLTEFLEAISLLGIKSAISFECNTSANNNLNVVASNVAIEAAKSISGLQIAQTELLEEDEEDPNAVVAKLAVSNSVLSGQQEIHQTQATRAIEYIDVYNDQPKITYSIEHMSDTPNGNQYILTENTGTFTITQSTTPVTKLDVSSGSVSEVGHSNVSQGMVEDEAEGETTEDVEESNIPLIEEEYITPSDPLIDMHTEVDIGNDDDGMPGGDIDDEMLEMKPRKSELKSRARKLIKKLTTKQQHHFTALKSEIKTASGNDALELAAQAVLHEGLSLQKAADRFDISKTVLWRRVRTNPDYMKHSREKPSLTEAYARLKNGDSLKNISQDLQIPMSTLHRHKVRLAAQGRLPDFVSCRRRDTTPKDELRDKLAKAVHACLNEGMSQNHAANLFEIPKSTLWRHLQRRVAETGQKVKREEEEQDDEDEMLN